MKNNFENFGRFLLKLLAFKFTSFEKPLSKTVANCYQILSSLQRETPNLPLDKIHKTRLFVKIIFPSPREITHLCPISTILINSIGTTDIQCHTYHRFFEVYKFININTDISFPPIISVLKMKRTNSLKPLISRLSLGILTGDKTEPSTLKVTLTLL